MAGKGWLARYSQRSVAPSAAPSRLAHLQGRVCARVYLASLWRSHKKSHVPQACSFRGNVLPTSAACRTERSTYDAPQMDDVGVELMDGQPLLIQPRLRVDPSINEWAMS